MTHESKPWEDGPGALVALGDMEPLPSLTAPGKLVFMSPGQIGWLMALLDYRESDLYAWHRWGLGLWGCCLWGG